MIALDAPVMYYHRADVQCDPGTGYKRQPGCDLARLNVSDTDGPWRVGVFARNRRGRMFHSSRTVGVQLSGRS